MIECLMCNKKFAERNKGKITEKKFCSERCGSIFRARQNYSIGKKLQLRKTNPKLYNKLLIDNYNKHPEKWKSRAITNQFFNQISNLDKLIPTKCKNCHGNNRLEIHHEIYPTTHSKIIDAVLEGRIYYLCKSCHSKSNRKL